MCENNSYKSGFKGGVPIGLGYLSVSFAFGIFAKTLGLNIFETVLISMLNLTSAGQLAAVPIIAAQGSLLELALSQIIINLRYALMGVSLSQKFGNSVRLRHRLLISFGNTDEVFAVAMANPGRVGKRYMYGLITAPWVGWTLGTLLGAVAGSILPAIAVSALGIAIYAMFIAIVLPVAKESKSTAVCVLLAAVLAAAFYFVPALNKIPSGFTVIIIAVSVGLFCAWMFPVKTEGAGKGEGTPTALVNEGGPQND